MYCPKNKFNLLKSSITINILCNIFPCLGFLLLGLLTTAFVLSMVETSKQTGFVQVQENMNRTEITLLIKNIKELIKRYLWS